MTKSSNYVEYYLEKNQETNNKFIIWISKVKQIIFSKLQMNLLDLPDEDYMGYFEENFTPNDMVKIIFESNGISNNPTK
jgi:hypothetical protein